MQDMQKRSKQEHLNLKQESRLVSLGYTVIYLGYDGNPGFGYLEC